MQKFEEQVKQFPIEEKTGDGVASISRVDGGFEVRMEKGET